jgi:hypothetical protein
LFCEELYKQAGLSDRNWIKPKVIFVKKKFTDFDALRSDGRRGIGAGHPNVWAKSASATAMLLCLYAQKIIMPDFKRVG